MKKRHIIIMPVLIVIGTAIFTASCKKEKDLTDQGCPIGGIDADARFMFWVSKDYGGGVYKVRITDKDGNNIALDYNTLSVYEPIAPDACNKQEVNYAKHALARLHYGETFSYAATSDNRTFKGTITVPCDDSYNCKAIQIDKDYL